MFDEQEDKVLALPKRLPAARVADWTKRGRQKVRSWAQ